MEKPTTPQTHSGKQVPMSPENCSRSAATRAANLLLGSFPRTDFNDPEIFIRRLIEIFLAYPELVVVDVAKRLPLQENVKYLYLSEVEKACKLRARSTSHWDGVMAETLERRKADAAAAVRARPSSAELDAQFARLGLSHLRTGSKFRPPDPHPRQPGKEPEPLTGQIPVSDELRENLANAAKRGY